jgi:hypothetical protein
MDSQKLVSPPASLFFVGEQSKLGMSSTAEFEYSSLSQGFRKEFLTRGAEVQGMFWGLQGGGAIVDLGIGLPGIIRPTDEPHGIPEENSETWKQLEAAAKGEVIKVGSWTGVLFLHRTL